RSNTVICIIYNSIFFSLRFLQLQMIKMKTLTLVCLLIASMMVMSPDGVDGICVFSGCGKNLGRKENGEWLEQWELDGYASKSECRKRCKSGFKLKVSLESRQLPINK
uniref:Uncharacterized protein n=1 Tax=Clytia hemisphaerica TaxID=252671 RepID=A0A7M5WRG3_9CNID